METSIKSRKRRALRPLEFEDELELDLDLDLEPDPELKREPPTKRLARRDIRESI